MPLQDVAILLPCQSFEDFPAHLDRQEATELLAAWSLSWHPELLAATGQMPSWHPAAAPPEHMPETVILVPAAAAEQLPLGWLDRIESDSHDSIVVRQFEPRPWRLSDAIPGLETGRTRKLAVRPPNCRTDCGDTIRDFFALGLCYLMVELQSQQMRYSSNLDTLQMQECAVEAANSAVAGDSTATRQALQRAFDALASARDYYYPVDSYLIDVTLVAPSIFGEPLRDRLAEPTPTNVLMSGEMLEQMAADEPASVAALRAAIDRGTASVVGGEYRETDLVLAPPQTWVNGLTRGREVYERHLGRAPRIYGRRALEFPPRLPQVLKSFEFSGVLAATFDGHQLPKSRQSKTRWAGAGDVQIDCLWRVPTDTEAAENILRFAHDAGNAMDHDFVATLLFAGWPGAACPWHDDLRRATEFGLALGQFVTLDTYFETTAHSDAIMRPAADGRRGIESVLAITDDPISTRVAGRAERASHETRSRLEIFSEILSSDNTNDPLVVNLHDFTQTIHLPTSSEPDNSGDPDVSNGLDITTVRAASNAQPFSWGNPPDRFVIDVPGLGFSRQTDLPPRKPPVPLAEGSRLQNEFLQVEFDSSTGAIRGIGEYARRGPSVAQQIAFRTSSNADMARGRDRPSLSEYSVMAADAIHVSTANAACGQIEVDGRLLDRGGEPIATFRQTTRLPWASRLVLLEVELTPQRVPHPSRGESYYALRFAWPVGEAFLCDSGGGTRESSPAQWIEAGDYVDVRQPAGSWTLFPMGLPLHRRVGETELDTLLIVNGESQRQFRCAIGIGHAPNTLATTAESLFGVGYPVFLPAPRSVTEDSAWLFHVDATNVHLAELALLGNGRSGVTIGLMETIGHETETVVRAFRNATSARQVSLAGETVNELPTDGNVIPIRIEPYEWIRIEIEWT